MQVASNIFRFVWIIFEICLKCEIEKVFFSTQVIYFSLNYILNLNLHYHTATYQSWCGPVLLASRPLSVVPDSLPTPHACRFLHLVRSMSPSRWKGPSSCSCQWARLVWPAEIRRPTWSDLLHHHHQCWDHRCADAERAAPRRWDRCGWKRGCDC